MWYVNDKKWKPALKWVLFADRRPRCECIGRSTRWLVFCFCFEMQASTEMWDVNAQHRPVHPMTRRRFKKMKASTEMGFICRAPPEMWMHRPVHPMTRIWHLASWLAVAPPAGGMAVPACVNSRSQRPGNLKRGFATPRLNFLGSLRPPAAPLDRCQCSKDAFSDPAKRCPGKHEKHLVRV